MNNALVITYPNRYAIEEAEELVKAAGYQPIALLTQGYLSRARYGLGSGKAEEAAKMVRERSADLIVFDTRLSSSQSYNLAKLCRVEVKDREKIILEIFARRASTAEAKLQVQLAELAYELPKAKNDVRMAKSGEQPGFFGLGRYEVDVYVRMVRRRMSTLRTKVGEVRKRREIFRTERGKQMFHTVALAGYTASGKTTLFNRLTGERREVDAGVFTTLSPTTRAVSVGDEKVMVTDTVGFISNLPTYMVEAFRSTLEQVQYADVVLLMVDASQPDEKFLRSYWSSMQTLGDLEVDPSKTLTLLNKCDLATDGVVEQRKRMVGPDAIAISAKTGEGVEEFFKVMKQKLANGHEAWREEMR